MISIKIGYNFKWCNCLQLGVHQKKNKIKLNEMGMGMENERKMYLLLSTDDAGFRSCASPPKLKHQNQINDEMTEREQRHAIF